MGQFSRQKSKIFIIMINKQASALPRRLIRKFKCNDPFELAEALDIDVMERADFKRQK